MEGPKTKKNIVFVCTGNTCRSPMAEVVFRSELRRRNLTDVDVFSAGLRARGEENINLKSVSVLVENGFSVENFHAKNLDAQTLRDAYAIVCMTDEMRDLLMDLRWDMLRKAGETEFENNVYSFSDICGYEIPDPYGGDVELYRQTFTSIVKAMPPLFERLFPVLEQQKQAEEQVAATSEKPQNPDLAAENKQPTPKKKRGRPKKQTSEKPQPSTPPKKRGRPKKQTQQ